MQTQPLKQVNALSVNLKSNSEFKIILRSFHFLFIVDN